MKTDNEVLGVHALTPISTQLPMHYTNARTAWDALLAHSHAQVPGSTYSSIKLQSRPKCFLKAKPNLEPTPYP
eukprot:6183886-Pleurochrysis_carterae.AAC.1